jgi:hypothetical protein
MALQPGQVLIGPKATVSYEAGETVSPGDVVGIDGDQLRRGNSGDTSPNPIGVVGHGGGASGGEDYEAGENAPVLTRAEAVITNVATGVSAGEELAASATDGQLAAGDGDGYEAITNEGDASGLATDEPVPAGYAGVKTP